MERRVSGAAYNINNYYYKRERERERSLDLLPKVKRCRKNPEEKGEAERKRNLMAVYLFLLLFGRLYLRHRWFEHDGHGEDPGDGRERQRAHLLPARVQRVAA